MPLAVCVPAKAAEPSVDQLRAALARLSSDSWTNADIELVLQFPEVAKTVADPRREPVSQLSATAPEVVSAARQRSGAQAAVLAVSCRTVFHDLTYKSLLGFDIYKWRHHVKFCYDGTRVTSIPERYDALMWHDGTRELHERTVDQSGGVGTTFAYSHIQRKIGACTVIVGCYGWTYPWSRIDLLDNGGYVRTGSSG